MTDEDDLIEEIVQLQDAFEDYAETSQTTQRERRVENIQVLVALAVIGAAISIYSYPQSNNPIRQLLSSSNFLNILFLTFIASNVVFLILKLLTIPLYEPNQKSWIAYIHRYIEPLLYFFTVSGVGVGILVWIFLVSTDFNPGSTVRAIIAVTSLLIPLFIASMIAQLSRIRSILDAYQRALTNIERSFRNSESVGNLTDQEKIEMVARAHMFLIPSSIVFRIFALLMESITNYLDLVSSILYKISAVLPGILGEVVFQLADSTSWAAELYSQFTRASYAIAKDSSGGNYGELLSLAIRSSSSSDKQESGGGKNSGRIRELFEKADEDELSHQEMKELSNLLEEHYEPEQTKGSDF
ncbi:hypothetical protein PNQ92_12945 [Halobacterium salinarum]|uniref:hypothetical protein n=1 Tax=Halobacterium salinarum TaxID=2242 RepID=UPI0025577C54|nr:hypothetical protein [Halobacterium salinarum]MDL0126307.1 hypothetical protein [Halobacterium salinarum]